MFYVEFLRFYARSISGIFSVYHLVLGKEDDVGMIFYSREERNVIAVEESWWSPHSLRNHILNRISGNSEDANRLTWRILETCSLQDFQEFWKWLCSLNIVTSCNFKKVFRIKCFISNIRTKIFFRRFKNFKHFVSDNTNWKYSLKLQTFRRLFTFIYVVAKTKTFIEISIILFNIYIHIKSGFPANQIRRIDSQTENQKVHCQQHH